MKILTGLFEQMVIRRNADGVSEQPLPGSAPPAEGKLKLVYAALTAERSRG